jgi:hypothetical protein
LCGKFILVRAEQRRTAVLVSKHTLPNFSMLAVILVDGVV